MSSWIVHERHINALVHLALWGPSDTTNWLYGSSRWTYFHDGRTYEVNLGMPEEWNALGQMLWQENYNSVNSRYHESGTPEEFDYARPNRVPTIVEGIKIVDCYAYQASDHDGWEPSQAHSFCDTLHKSLAGRVAGYEQAPWGWDHA